jgi:hypothetical protein
MPEAEAQSQAIVAPRDAAASAGPRAFLPVAPAMASTQAHQ